MAQSKTWDTMASKSRLYKPTHYLVQLHLKPGLQQHQRAGYTKQMAIYS